MSEKYFSDLPVEAQEYQRSFEFRTERAISSAELFASYQAEGFIDLFTVRDEFGKVDMYRTAEKLGYPLEVKYLDGGIELYGRTYIIDSEDSPRLIEIAKDYSPQDQLFTFAHEVGHIFYYRLLENKPRKLTHNQEESFCDFFGRAMVIPRAALEKLYLTDIDEALVLEIAKTFGQSITTVLIQLMEYGHLEEKVYFDAYSSWAAQYDSRSANIDRHVVCLACKDDEGGECTHPIESGRLFDFTNAVVPENVHCRGESYVLNKDAQGFLTSHYEKTNLQPPLFHYYPRYDTEASIAHHRREDSERSESRFFNEPPF